MFGRIYGTWQLKPNDRIGKQKNNAEEKFHKVQKRIEEKEKKQFYKRGN